MYFGRKPYCGDVDPANSGGPLTGCNCQLHMQAFPLDPSTPGLASPVPRFCWVCITLYLLFYSALIVLFRRVRLCVSSGLSEEHLDVFCGVRCSNCVFCH